MKNKLVLKTIKNVFLRLGVFVCFVLFCMMLAWISKNYSDKLLELFGWFIAGIVIIIVLFSVIYESYIDAKKDLEQKEYTNKVINKMENSKNEQ